MPHSSLASSLLPSSSCISFCSHLLIPSCFCPVIPFQLASDEFFKTWATFITGYEKVRTHTHTHTQRMVRMRARELGGGRGGRRRGERQREREREREREDWLFPPAGPRGQSQGGGGACRGREESQGCRREEGYISSPSSPLRSSILYLPVSVRFQLPFPSSSHHPLLIRLAS